MKGWRGNPSLYKLIVVKYVFIVHSVIAGFLVHLDILKIDRFRGKIILKGVLEQYAENQEFSSIQILELPSSFHPFF